MKKNYSEKIVGYVEKQGEFNGNAYHNYYLVTILHENGIPVFQHNPQFFQNSSFSFDFTPLFFDFTVLISIFTDCIKSATASTKTAMNEIITMDFTSKDAKNILSPQMFFNTFIHVAHRHRIENIISCVLRIRQQ